MSEMIARSAENTEESAISGMLTAADMVTVTMQLVHPAHELALSVPRAEWLKLISGFVKMPADERQRVGVSIREATAQDPFPTEDGVMLTPKEQRRCDVFVNDCILLAALAEAVGPRILLDTTVEAYKVVSGLPQLGHIKGAFN